MTYDTLERSDHGGQPVRLYQFQRGAEIYRYTSAEADVTFDSHTWSTRLGGVSDNGIQQVGPNENDQLVIKAAWDFPVAELFRGTPPADKVSVTVRRLHAGDSEAPIIWIGQVSSMRRPTGGSTELLCESLISTFRGNGLRLSWGRNCPHMLYDSQCRVDKSLHVRVITIASLTSASITAPEFAELSSGHFSGGFIEWEVSAGTNERRAIEEHAGDTIVLMAQTDGLEVGDTVSAYPGCQRNTSDCNGKFANMPNYGGIPHLPGKSPFTVGNPLTSTSPFSKK